VQSRILAEVGSEEEQAVLRNIAQDVNEVMEDATICSCRFFSLCKLICVLLCVTVRQQLSVRLRVLTALRGVMKPSDATLDLIRSFMQIQKVHFCLCLLLCQSWCRFVSV
jgi:hypothetical protein